MLRNTAYISLELIEKIKLLIGKKDVYHSYSDVIRIAIRELIKKELNRLYKINEIKKINKKSHIIIPENDDYKIYKIIGEA